LICHWSSEPHLTLFSLSVYKMWGVAGTVNVHPSLLPLYRGAAPVQRALLVKML
jgi:folate-dependent phosphoribosylglycinamide formyltransferase PurN